MSMLIGLDFDNTLANYDRLFRTLARELGLIPAPPDTWTKKQVRDHIRRHVPDGELAWQRLQGQVYGARMGEAELISGVAAFLHRCRERKVPVVIVSHKTRYGHYDPARVDLRKAALRWMAGQGFFAEDGFALSTGSVHFEPTRAAKIARIADLGCSHFVDDLEEILREPSFPASTRRYLFAPGQASLPSGPFIAHTGWGTLADDLLADI